MNWFFSKLGAWWATGPAHRSGEPFALVCACGRALTGQRLSIQQSIHCPSCQAELFVLPLSPWPRTCSPAVPTTSTEGRHALLWLLPILAAAVALLLLVVGYRWVFPPILPNHANKPLHAGEPVPAPSAANLEQALARGRQAWLEGQFGVALEQVQLAQSLKARLPAAEQARYQELERLSREVRLYACLSHESLEEILRQASGLADAEWLATFHQRYKGKTVILDGEAARQGGIWQLRFPLDVPGDKVVLAIDELECLNVLPGEAPQRIVFGAALESIRRVRDNVWQIRFDGYHAALLTRQEPLAFCCPGLGDQATRQVLQRQRELLELPLPTNPEKK